MLSIAIKIGRVVLSAVVELLVSLDLLNLTVSN